jgi:hypothetical protein
MGGVRGLRLGTVLDLATSLGPIDGSADIVTDRDRVSIPPPRRYVAPDPPLDSRGTTTYLDGSGRQVVLTDLDGQRPHRLRARLQPLCSPLPL